MSGSIVHRSTADTVAHPTPRPCPQAGPSESTADVEFGGTIDTWDDLPDETRIAAHWGTGVVAEQVERLTRGALKVDGVPHQRMIGWRAHVDRVVVATAVRPLVQRPDGRLAPRGAWRHHDVTVHLPAEPVRRRDGVVPTDSAPSGTGHDGGTPAGPSPRIPADHRSAASSCAHLPAAVQQGLLDAVPEPTLWLGELVQNSDDGYPIRHRLNSLRLDAGRAVVVRAERHLPATRGYRTPDEARNVLAATSWDVAQLTYDLDPAATSRGVLDRGGSR